MLKFIYEMAHTWLNALGTVLTDRAVHIEDVLEKDLSGHIYLWKP